LDTKCDDEPITNCGRRRHRRGLHRRGAGREEGEPYLAILRCRYERLLIPAKRRAAYERGVREPPPAPASCRGAAQAFTGQALQSGKEGAAAGVAGGEKRRWPPGPEQPPALAQRRVLVAASTEDHSLSKVWRHSVKAVASRRSLPQIP
jgi:hypothetical protein